jgi:hypothetical protein
MIEIDVGTLIAALGGTGTLAGLGGFALKAYASKRTFDAKEHAADRALERASHQASLDAAQRHAATVLELLNREQAAHLRTHDRLSAAQTEIALRESQVGDLGARVDLMEPQVKEALERASRSETANAECEERARRLASRVAALELQRGRPITPPNDTPAVQKRPDGILPPPLPPMHESVGGYRHGR